MRRRALIATIGLVIAAGALAASQPVTAAWTDTEFATTSVVSTSLVAPTKTSCSVDVVLGLSATFNWTNPTTGAPRTGYVFQIYNGATLVGSATPAANATTQSTSGLLSTLLNSVTYTVQLRAANNLWRSPVATGTFTTTALGLITSCTW
ncbi:hypothetical protein [Microbacterium candidum]|uniref:Fibronectin type-III domain-containing protein n=1 Tax=Microbacterium candidum TaxID=3041922 RepID=A0ABT7MX31_9MICO|nr:hypothetical protein [Microbacterium sp. ASV49]MDL9978991.1 hypothetical protein [Microbacterium sp. ASV49]